MSKDLTTWVLLPCWIQLVWSIAASTTTTPSMSEPAALTSLADVDVVELEASEWMGSGLSSTACWAGLSWSAGSSMAASSSGLSTWIAPSGTGIGAISSGPKRSLATASSGQVQDPRGSRCWSVIAISPCFMWKSFQNLCSMALLTAADLSVCPPA